MTERPFQLTALPLKEEAVVEAVTASCIIATGAPSSTLPPSDGRSQGVDWRRPEGHARLRACAVTPASWWSSNARRRVPRCKSSWPSSCARSEAEVIVSTAWNDVDVAG